LGKIENSDALLACLTTIYDLLVKFPQKAAEISGDSTLYGTLRGSLLCGDEMIAGHVARIFSVIALYAYTPQI
jgi:hypothetical protein